MEEIGKKTFNGVLWNIFCNFGCNLMGIASGIILARLLFPEDYGLLGVLTVFFSISHSLIDGGLNTVLLRKKEITEEEYAVVFWYNLTAALLCYAILFAAAPYVANFYGKPVLTPLLQLTALSLPLGALASIPSLKLEHELKQNVLSKITLSVNFFSQLMTIGLALAGCGVWALAWGYLIPKIITLAVFAVVVRWRPRSWFRWRVFKSFLNMSCVMLVIIFMNGIFDNLYNLVIGKIFNFVQLGFYTKGNSYGGMWSKTIGGCFRSVALPALAQFQDDLPLLEKNFAKFMIVSGMVVAIPSTILLAVSEPLMIFLLTEKWRAIIPFMRVVLLWGMLYPFDMLNDKIIVIMDKPGWLFRIYVMQKILIVGNILITWRFGVLYMVWGQLVCSILSIFIFCHYTRQLIHTGAWRQIRLLLPLWVVCAVVTAAGLAFVSYLPVDVNIIKVLCGGALMTGIYWLYFRIFRPGYFNTALGAINQYMPKLSPLLRWLFPEKTTVKAL